MSKSFPEQCEVGHCTKMLINENPDYVKLGAIRFRAWLCNDHYREARVIGVVPRLHWPDAFICPWCGDLQPTEAAEEIRFTHKAMGIILNVCARCATQEPCVANHTGIHGEVYDGDYDGVRPPLPFEPDGQHGWCSRCYLPMVWSVDRQRWIDWPEIDSPKSRLERAMDARDHGLLTEDEYAEVVVEALRA